MCKIRAFISLWCVVFFIAAVVCAQLDAINSFYSDINHRGTHIESADPANNYCEETKQISLHPACFDVPPFFVPPFVAFSCGQLVFQHPHVYKSDIPTEFCGRAPPA
jgi:hypothetical protein